MVGAGSPSWVVICRLPKIHEGPLCADCRSPGSVFQRLLSGKPTLRIEISEAAKCPMLPLRFASAAGTACDYVVMWTDRHALSITTAVKAWYEILGGMIYE